MKITDFVVLLSFVNDKIVDISLKFISSPKIRNEITSQAPTNVILVLAD